MYDQQDIYDYYDRVIKIDNKQTLTLEIEKIKLQPRKEMLPFESCLEDYECIFKEFLFPYEKQALSNIRHQNFSLSVELLSQTKHELSKRVVSCYTSPSHSFKKLNEDCLIRENSYNRNFDLDLGSVPSDLDLIPSDKNLSSILNKCSSYGITPRLEIECQASFRKNRVLYVVYSMILTVTHFCRTTFNILLSNRQVKAHIFLNEYSKRFRSYIEFAAHINEQLENINVLVNYAYDSVFNEKEQIFPKFSVLRLFVRKNLLYLGYHLEYRGLSKSEKSNRGKFNYQSYHSSL